MVLSLEYFTHTLVNQFFPLISPELVNLILKVMVKVPIIIRPEGMYLALVTILEMLVSRSLTESGTMKVSPQR